MFSFFKRRKPDNGLDVKGLRESILQLIKEELQRLDGGEGTYISVLQLFINPADKERFIYEAALYTADPEKLQEEIQRIADNFALDLPSGWRIEVSFATAIPAEAIQKKEINTGLIIQTASPLTAKTTVNIAGAQLRVLKGLAEQQEYTFDKDNGRINIGREKNIQAGDGSFRTNNIAFPETAENENNKYISRQHAHIEWDKNALCFKLYADEGGIPPGNKTKIRSAQDESLHRINSVQIGYQLKAGDQIILGDAAVLEFTILIKNAID